MFAKIFLYFNIIEVPPAKRRASGYFEHKVLSALIDIGLKISIL